MNKENPIIGIFGGIGSGKSTVAAMFVTLGCAVILVGGIGMFKSMKSRFVSSPEERFWTWFQDNESKLYEFGIDPEGMTRKLTAALRDVHPDLVFEISHKTTGDKREFVISADGLLQAFPAVESLYEKAPELDHWIIFKFRLRESVDNILEFKGKQVNGMDVKYLMVKDEDPGKVGLLLFIPGYSEDGEESEAYMGIGYIFLDHALGEYDAVTRIGGVCFVSTESELFEKAQPLSQLPEHFDYYFSQSNE